MTHLSDSQFVLLAAAAQRDDGSLLPLPTSMTKHAALTRTIRALLNKALVTEAPASEAASIWRRDGERAIGIFITKAGRAAIGDEPTRTGEEVVAPSPVEQPTMAVTAKPATKIIQVIELLRRADGATVAELTAVTGWLSHTTRAALTRLRQKDHVLHKGKRGELTRYMIVDAA